jgi:hypothetical protein
MKTLAGIVVCLLAACVVKKENPVDTLATTASSSTTVVHTDTVFEKGDARAIVIDDDVRGIPWTVTPEGIGPLRVGMTVAEANKAVSGGFSAPPSADPACSYARTAKAPEGVAVMLQNNKIARVEIRNGSTPTAEGARIGDTESRINSLYSGRVTTSAHKYVTGGHYLTITPVNDTTHRIVFETDGKVVTNYRAGVLPAVEYVERCG